MLVGPVTQGLHLGSRLWLKRLLTRWSCNRSAGSQLYHRKLCRRTPNIRKLRMFILENGKGNPTIWDEEVVETIPLPDFNPFADYRIAVRTSPDVTRGKKCERNQSSGKREPERNETEAKIHFLTFNIADISVLFDATHTCRVATYATSPSIRTNAEERSKREK